MWELWTLFPLAQPPGAKGSHKAPLAPSPPPAYSPHLGERNGSQTPTATCPPILVGPPSEPPLEEQAQRSKSICPKSQSRWKEDRAQMSQPSGSEIHWRQSMKHESRGAGGLWGRTAPLPPRPITVLAPRPCAPCWPPESLRPQPGMQMVLTK